MVTPLAGAEHGLELAGGREMLLGVTCLWSGGPPTKGAPSTAHGEGAGTEEVWLGEGASLRLLGKGHGIE